MAHLAWKKGLCHGRAAFLTTFQHEITFSLKTRNRSINFAMLPKYYIGKILPKHRISAIFAHKSRYTSFLHGVFGNPSCFFVSDWLRHTRSTLPYDAQPSDCIKQCPIFKPLRNRPNKPVYAVTFISRYCVISRWLPANKAVIFYYLSDPGLRRIPCYILLHCSEVLSFNCGLSVAKYRNRWSAMKNNNIGIGPKKPYRSSSP